MDVVSVFCVVNDELKIFVVGVWPLVVVLGEQILNDPKRFEVVSLVGVGCDSTGGAVFASEEIMLVSGLVVGVPIEKELNGAELVVDVVVSVNEAAKIIARKLGETIKESIVENYLPLKTRTRMLCWLKRWEMVWGLLAVLVQQLSHQKLRT